MLNPITCPPPPLPKLCKLMTWMLFLLVRVEGGKTKLCKHMLVCHSRVSNSASFIAKCIVKHDSSLLVGHMTQTHCTIQETPVEKPLPPSVNALARTLSQFQAMITSMLGLKIMSHHLPTYLASASPIKVCLTGEWRAKPSSFHFLEEKCRGSDAKDRK